MNEKQMKEEVIRYIDDSNYPYALLIDGEWGCGKTYFMLNSLKQEIEEHENKKKEGRELKYISVYGCKSVEEIEENLYWSIIDRKFFQLKDSIESKRLSKYFGQKKQKKDRQGKILWAASKKLINTAMQKFNLSYKAFEYIEEFFSLDHYIFVIDDLERCNCSINDILGYINGLVEHEGVKVLIIANEKEIGRLSKVECKELQYLIASNMEIKLLRQAPANQLQNNSERTQKQLTPEELERRRGEIFTENDLEKQYLGIKEKLIGVTILYQPDFSNVIHKLIVKSSCADNLKKLLNQDAKFFIEKMDEYGHHNFRTFQFFLSKVDYLYGKLGEKDIDKKYLEPVAKFVAENCFMLCIEYKGNIKEPDNELLKIIRKQRNNFESIREYIQMSIFDEDIFEKEIRLYIQDELINKIAPDDPFSELHNNYYLKSQQWNEEKIEQVIVKLSNDEYPANVYTKILCLFMNLRRLGFSNQIVERATQKMIANAKKGSINQEISYNYLHLDNKEDLIEIRRILNEINDKISENRANIRSNSIREMLTDKDNWAKLIQGYIKTEQFKKDGKSGILNKVSAKTWIDTIVNSDPENIFIFRGLLSKIYPYDIILKRAFEDMPFMKEIIEGLEKYDGQDDIIQRAQIMWLINDMKKIYKNQTTDLS